MRQKRKYLKTSKAAMSVSTAFLVISTIVSAAGNAAQTNEFVISADKSYADTGDSFNVFIDFLPDVTGAAGFTVDLHYDAEKVAPNVPDGDGVSAGDDFYIVSNYKVDDGIVRLVGVNMGGDNVNKDSRIASASFTVLDGAEGELDYWLDVETLVYFSGEDYFNADYSAPDSASPYSVNVFEEPATTTTTTTTSVTTEPSVTETEPPATTTTSESTTTSAPIVVEIPDPDTTTTTTVPETSKPDAETAPQVTTTVSQGRGNMFEHSAKSYDESTAGEAEIVQYGFNISDYITDYNSLYDIRVKLDTSGYLMGGIGMMNDLGSWESQSFETVSGSDEWVFTDLDPNKCWDQVFVQIYYLQYGARMEISSIEFVPHEKADSTPAPSQPENSEPSADVPSGEGSQPDSDPGYTPTVPVEPETSDSPDSEMEETSKKEPQIPEIVTPEVGASDGEKEDQENEAPKDTAPNEEGGSSENNTPVVSEEKKPETEGEKTPADKTDPSEVENKLSELASEADKNSTSGANNANPNTGSRRSVSPMIAILQAAAALQIFYSLFAIIYNKLGSRKIIRK